MSPTLDTPYRFDDRNIRWFKLGDLEHFVFMILDIDESRGIVDFLARLEPHKQILLHEHVALTTTWVVEGEHILYEPDGSLKDVRPAGRYSTTLPGSAPHRECGGDNGAIIFYSVRGDRGVYFNLMDDQMNVIAALSFQDLQAAHKEQQQAMKANASAAG
jgi:hypothetical protein